VKDVAVGLGIGKGIFSFAATSGLAITCSMDIYHPGLFVLGGFGQEIEERELKVGAVAKG
jgi:hypothetical protein